MHASTRPFGMKPISFLWRMTIWNAVVFTLLLIAFGALVFVLLRETHLKQVDAGLRSQLAEVKRAVEQAEHPDAALTDWVERISKRPRQAALVLSSDGAVLAADPRITPSAQSALTGLAAAGPGAFSIWLPGLDHRRVMVAQVATGSGSYSMVVALSLAHVDEEMRQVLFVLAASIPVALAVAAVLAFVLARQALRPVERLRRLAKEISVDRLDRRLPVVNPKDELGKLAETINDMIARLERSFSEVRRFTADASHELRTPVAIIRAESEEELDRISPHAEHRPLLRSILEECQRLSRLTDQLLMLSREDARAFAAPQGLVDLTSLAHEEVATMRPLAEGKHQTLILDADETIHAFVDGERLRQVLRNLIDNAIKYSGDGCQVQVTVERRGTEAVISIADDGRGIPSEHLPKVFDRFYRVEQSRSRSNGGAGLGLSIAASIVESHGGRIAVTSQVGEGTAFEVRLPLDTRQDEEGV